MSLKENLLLLAVMSLHLEVIAALSEGVTVDLESEGNPGHHRQKRQMFNLFQIVQFPNSGCVGSGSKNGTCFTTSECAQNSGVAAGTCALGYGVCCVFTAGCGQSYSQNITYFESSTVTAGSCTAQVCPINNNICQMRLDFNTFMIMGPSTKSTTDVTITGGVANAGGNPATVASQCLTDRFAVTSTGTSSPPVICGTNSGEHMYVDVRDGNCANLAMQLGPAAIMGTVMTPRSWQIKVTQYACTFANLAPAGCTQYFFGPTSQTVKTYNFAGGQHLANQKQQICVRRERGQCKICWTTTMDMDFVVSGNTAIMQGYTGDQCCGYGTDGAGTNGYDCVVIPGALKSSTGAIQGKDKLCGRSKGLVTMEPGTTAATICSRKIPFSIQFLSDTYEFENEAMTTDKGFRLTYIQSSTKC